MDLLAAAGQRLLLQAVAPAAEGAASAPGAAAAPATAVDSGNGTEGYQVLLRVLPSAWRPTYCTSSAAAATKWEDRPSGCLRRCCLHRILNRRRLLACSACPAILPAGVFWHLLLHQCLGAHLLQYSHFWRELANWVGARAVAVPTARSWFALAWRAGVQQQCMPALPCSPHFFAHQLHHSLPTASRLARYHPTHHGAPPALHAFLPRSMWVNLILGLICYLGFILFRGMKGFEFYHARLVSTGGAAHA
jgi:hypothetical protein